MAWRRRSDLAAAGSGSRVGAFICLLVLAVVAACGQRSSPAGARAGATVTSALTSAVSTTPAVDYGAPLWIPLKSSSPADILAAVKQSTLFHLNCSPSSDCLQDLSHLGTPVLVTELRTQETRTSTDYYIIPVLDTAGNMDALASAELNCAHTAIHVQGISGSGPRWPRLVTADGAVAGVQAQHHTGLRSGARPTLVRLPLDQFALQTGQIVWTARGKSALDPVWLVPDTDGKDHLVGADGRAYYLSQFPLALSQ